VRQALHGVDYVFHLAAMVSVPESMAAPIECHELNTVGTLLVLEEAARARVKKLVFSSSAAIYGDNPVTPKVETMVPEPRSPYATSKLDGEHHCRRFADEGRVATVCLRYFNVFGPRQDPASAYAAAVPIFIHRALRHEPITIHGDGGQTRDFIPVREVAAANLFLAEHRTATGVFNVACGRQLTIKALAAEICRLAASRSELIHGPGRAGDVRHSLGSIQRLQEAGFSPTGDLGADLQATIDYFRAPA
jgi:UDP-glucose 4-epimerase